MSFTLHAIFTSVKLVFYETFEPSYHLYVILVLRLKSPQIRKNALNMLVYLVILLSFYFGYPENPWVNSLNGAQRSSLRSPLATKIVSTKIW